MIRKQFVKSRQVYKVTFTLPKEEWPQGVDVNSVHLVGDFNDWSRTATPMEANSKGIFRTVLDLAPGENYQFKYLINNELWANEWLADAYHPNEFGEENSVILCPLP